MLLGEIDRFLERCTQGETAQRDRLIFRLYFRQKFTANEIAALPDLGLSVKGVESAIFRLVRQVREAILGEKRKAKAADAKGFSHGKPSLQGENT